MGTPVPGAHVRDRLGPARARSVDLMSALSPHVACLTAYDVVGEPGVHIGMPSTRLTLVLPVGEPLDVGWSGGRTRGRWAGVSGLHPAPAAIHHGRRQRGVYLELTVAGVRALLGVPAGYLAGQMVEVAALAPDLRHLPEALAGAPASPPRGGPPTQGVSRVPTAETQGSRTATLAAARGLACGLGRVARRARALAVPDVVLGATLSNRDDVVSLERRAHATWPADRAAISSSQHRSAVLQLDDLEVAWRLA